MSVFGVILVRIFPHSGWIQRDTPYLSVFSPNAGKCGPESFRIRTLFTQWILPLVFFEKRDKLLFSHLTQLWQHNSWLRGWTLFQWFECSNACSNGCECSNACEAFDCLQKYLYKKYMCGRIFLNTIKHKRVTSHYYH